MLSIFRVEFGLFCFCLTVNWHRIRVSITVSNLLSTDYRVHGIVFARSGRYRSIVQASLQVRCRWTQWTRRISWINAWTDEIVFPVARYRKLGRDQLMGMSVLPELEEFLQDAQENATMLNRYCHDTSSCLINQKVRESTFDCCHLFSRRNEFITYSQAFAAGNLSLLSNVPKKMRQHLATLGHYKAAFDLKKHPAFTGNLSEQISASWI